MTATPISTEVYLRNKIMKENKKQTNGKLNELIDIFAKIDDHEQISKLEMERKYTETKVIQPADNIDAEHNKDHHNPQAIKQ